MIVYRLCKAKYADDLSGTGAEKTGGRWNSKGTAVLYTGSSRALCTAELAIHLPLGIIPTDYVLVAIEIPDNITINELHPSQLPKGWNAVPHNEISQNIGNRFIHENQTLLLKVPSVVVPGDYNYLINPNHNDFKRIKIKEKTLFTFDKRLFSRT
ncbi:MAG: RES family NAD+ phosphorylase [Flavobacteriales bacterium]|nr:RES family NAD+ phosphorylase [Flavobacteriales bacterium]